MIKELLDTNIKNNQPQVGSPQKVILAFKNELINLKSTEIAKIDFSKGYSHGKYSFSIIELNKIDGGIEVYARVYESGEQIGFGEDGTVDIERFRFFNPPILVPDDLGDIVMVGKAGGDTDGTREFRYRESAEEAVIQALADTVDKIPRAPKGKIVPEKRGKTVTTFYPSLDGRCEEATVTGTWSTMVGGNGDGVDSASAQENCVIWGDNGTNYTKLTRAVYLFDTSALSGQTISSAIFSVQIYAKSTGGTNSPTYNVYASTPASESSLAATDYSNLGTTAFCDTAVAYGSVSLVTQTSWTLNATGIAAVSTTGVTKLGIREATYDVANNAPTKVNAQTYINGYYSEATGTTNDPNLVVTHTAAPASGPRKLSLLGVG